MKVQRATKLSSAAAKSPAPSKPVSGIRFTEILSKQSYEEQREELEKALAILDEKGKNLVENRTVENLYEYKQLIKEFIEETVMKGLEVRERRGFSTMGRAKVMRTVAEVDRKLLDLTDLILKRESKELNVLRKVGEIKGLLVNILL